MITLLDKLILHFFCVPTQFLNHLTLLRESRKLCLMTQNTIFMPLQERPIIFTMYFIPRDNIFIRH